MRVGLVLGAGGVLGGAWLTGALHALARESEWDPGSAEEIVGTSAGSVIGAFLAAGIPPWFMVAHSAGESFDGLNGPDGRPAAEADRSGGARYALHRGLPQIGPGSPRLALTTLARPLRHTPLQLLSGWLPQGLFSTSSIEETVRRAVPGRWVGHPGYRAVACEYGSGRRTAFGRADAPAAHIADAVAASCAIPGFFRPKRIAGRAYVDGGVRSPSSLDLVAGHGLDLVICLNPLTSREAVAGGPLDLLAHRSRAAGGRRLGREAARVRRHGTEVLLIQPVAEDLAAMGRNLMSTGPRRRVIEVATRTVSRALARPGARELLARLPAGEPHTVARPPGPPTAWPAILPARGTRPLAA